MATCSAGSLVGTIAPEPRVKAVHRKGGSVARRFAFRIVVAAVWVVSCAHPPAVNGPLQSFSSLSDAQSSRAVCGPWLPDERLGPVRGCAQGPARRFEYWWSDSSARAFEVGIAVALSASQAQAFADSVRSVLNASHGASAATCSYERSGFLVREWHWIGADSIQRVVILSVPPPALSATSNARTAVRIAHEACSDGRAPPSPSRDWVKTP